jgi:hypothetical protein
MNPTQRSYQVYGMPKPETAAQNNALLPQEDSPSSSLQLKPPRKEVIIRQPETPSSSARKIILGQEVETQLEESVACSYHDDLSNIIEETRSVQHVASISYF